MKILIITLAAIFTLPVLMVTAQVKGTSTNSVANQDTLILDLENQNNRARLAGDRVALQRLYADDFTGTSATGTSSSKADIVEFYSNDGAVMAVHSIDDVRVKFVGGVAIVTARLKYQYNEKKENRSVRWMRYTRVYAKYASDWRVVAEHFCLTDAP